MNYDIETYRKIFSKNLQEQMILKGKIQMDMMKELNLSSSTISNWVNGVRLPRMDKIQMLAEYFGVEVTDLLESKGTPSYLRRYAMNMVEKIPDNKLEQICSILETFIGE